MYLLAARQSYFSLHLPPKTRFPEYGSLLLIGQFEERNAEREWAAISGEDCYVTTLITAAKETNIYKAQTKCCSHCCPRQVDLPAESDGQELKNSTAYINKEQTETRPGQDKFES